MPRRAGWLWIALILPGCVAYPWLVHAIIVDGHALSLRVALALLPLLAFSYWVARYARNKFLWTILVIAAGAAIFVVERQDRFGLPAAYGISHSAINLFLLWLFGRTLISGQEPLITGFARRIHGTLPTRMEGYTRRVTVAWCVFFAAQVLVSTALLITGSLSTWSLFVNVLSLPLVVLMFVAEYLYRVMRYRHYPHVPIWKGIQIFAEDTRLSGVPESARKTDG
jgi:uncharacterized membrane protein